MSQQLVCECQDHIGLLFYSQENSQLDLKAHSGVDNALQFNQSILTLV